MILKPDDNWLWKFDKTQSQLCLELGDELVFQPYLNRKKMVAFPKSVMPFTVDDAAIYYQLLEQLSDYDLPSAVKVYWILNAITAIRFHKPMMPKSWFFEVQAGCYRPEQGEMIELACNAQQRARYLVLESNSQVSLCMLVDPKHEFSHQKALQQFDVIKVMNDRVCRVQQEPVQMCQVS
ncbi:MULTISPECIES: cell division protein ZapC domain-containing protein [unclassified Motilimonas]|uniref:cell division protein ZapC domain-containing protein n=1 Tax=Motilimonas TaxID=1914248 RepID=UPI001E414383|nr:MULTISPECIES: cell division protein ZapC domain-containing protein [unclassified Motilimonas]MCE0555475.1 cell division protein ZapC [Motilimonas sp. E26]MDO6526229.1 cell division protein ZapC [Motilimonas sp. 1_MG-2023]